MKKHRRVKWLAAGILLIGLIFVRELLQPENQVKHLVAQHQDELRSIAEAALEGLPVSESDLGAELEGVCKGTHDIVQFYHSGAGLVPSSRYFGFYYSPKDLPAAYQNVNDALVPVSEDTWTWSEQGTDNGGRTKRIQENWFYYEAWF